MNSNLNAAIIAGSIILLSTGLQKAHCAEPDPDSLKQIVYAQPASRGQADNLFFLTRVYYRAGQPDSARKYADMLLDLSTRLDYHERAADAVYYQALIYQSRNQLNEALAAFREHLDRVRPLDDNARLGKAMVMYSRILIMQGVTDTARVFLLKGLRIGRELQDTMMMLVSMNELGNMFQDLDQIDSSVFYYLEASRMCEAPNFRVHLRSLYNNLGKAFAKMNQYDESTRYLELALDLNRKENDHQEMALNLVNIGFNYLNLGDLEKTKAYFDRTAEELSYLDFESIDFANLYNGYAELYEQQGRYRDALINLNKAYAIYSRENFQDGIATTLSNKGNIYTKQGEYDKAERVLDSSFKVAIRAGYREKQKKVLWAMADNYYQGGNYKKAYEYYERYHNLYDSLFEEDRTIMINELNVKYNKEKVENENLTLKNRNLEMDLNLRKKTSQSTIFMFTFIGVLLIAISLALILRQRTIISRQKILQLEEEKKLLGAKLLVEGQEQERKRIARELHDGLGVLLSATKIQFSNIQDKSPENREIIEKATQLLEQATGDVRKISHNMMPGLLTRLGLFEAVEDLFENLNDIEDLEATCDIKAKMKRPPENVEIMLYRIIQELVNNTLKHAQAQNISIRIMPENGWMHIEYADDGKGFDAENVLLSRVASLGLKNIQSRVNFLNGKIDIVTSPGNGARFDISIPLGA